MEDSENLSSESPAEVARPGTLMEDFSPEMRRALMGVVDTNGNAGLGLVAKFGKCCECGRDNKIVGPRDFEPDARNCFGGCESQRGPTIFERRMANMRWHTP